MNGHKAVDLGLPSGLLWAECNVGAGTAVEYGGYYPWGETVFYGDMDHYKYHMDSSWTYYTKYNPSDRLSVLELEDDVARYVMGGEWRMPTKGEMEELVENTVSSSTVISGVSGTVLTSKVNGKRLFLPWAGYDDFTGYVPGGCLLWSSEVDTNLYLCPPILYAECYGDLVSYGEPSDRQNGLTVRGVVRLL